MIQLITTSTLPFTMALGACLLSSTTASPDTEGDGINITTGFVVTLVITALVVVQGLAQVLAPVATLKVYKSPTGKMNAHMFTVMGTSSLSLAVTTMCLLSSMRFAKSVGCALLPWIIVGAMNLVTEKNKEVGYAASNDLFSVIIGGFICFCCFSGFSFADHAAALFGGILLVNGATSVAVPDKHAQAWGSDLSVTNEKEPILPTSLRALGLNMLSLGTMITFSYLNFTPVQAFGYAWVWIIMMAMIPVFSKNIKGGLNAGHMMWFVPHALVLGTTIFSS